MSLDAFPGSFLRIHFRASIGGCPVQQRLGVQGKGLASQAKHMAGIAGSSGGYATVCRFVCTRVTCSSLFCLL
jgi:hypothetical protein